MFCAQGLVFGGAECVGSHFHVLRSRTHFWRYRGRRVPFSCFALPDSFSAVPKASGLVFMFCATGIVFGGAECVGSRFHFLRSRIRFRWYRARQVPFSCFARSDSFSAVPRASGPVFMFCAPGIVFGGTGGVGSLFHVLRSRTRFRRYRGRQTRFNILCSRNRFSRYRGRWVPFSCFALPDSFSAVLRASGPVFMFCAAGIILGGAECVGSRLHVLRSRIHFRCYLGRRVPFSCFARPVSFSPVPSASGPVFMFCAPGIVFGGNGGGGFLFHVLSSWTHFRLYQGVRSHFHVLRSRNRFRRYWGSQVPFSCFALPNSFSAVPRASGPVFICCDPRIVFSGTEVVGSLFHVLRS
jgi:hypothetical protein